MASGNGNLSWGGGMTSGVGRGGKEERNQDATTYVGNLDGAVTEELLWELRQQTGVFGFEKLYTLLEIVPSNRLASAATLRKAYHKASLKWHPDRHVNAEPAAKAAAAERFTEVKAAYEVLLEGMATGGAGNGATSLAGELTTG